MPEDNKLELLINSNKAPRRGSFEIVIKKDAESTDGVLIWSGIKKGPPRKDKFPDPKNIYKDIIQCFN